MSIDKRQVIVACVCLLIGAAIGFGASNLYAESPVQPYHVGSFRGGALLYKYDKRTGETWIAFHEEGVGYRWSRIFDPDPNSIEELLRELEDSNSEN